MDDHGHFGGLPHGYYPAEDRFSIVTNRRSSLDDVTRTWYESIAVKITASVVYAIVLIACVVASFLLSRNEQQLAQEFPDKADRIAYDIVIEMQRTPAVSDDDVAALVSRKLEEFGFSAASIVHGDRTIQIGKPDQNATVLIRLIPVSGNDVEASSRTLQATFYHAPLHDEVSYRRKTMFLITGAAALLFGLILAWGINRLIAGPILTLVNATKAVTGGNLSIRLDSDKADEFGILSRFFNRMLDRIEQELTERRQTEALLRSSEEEIGHILDSIRAGVLLINMDRHEIVYVNSLAAAMIGAPRDEIVGKICHKFVCPLEQGRCPITASKEMVDNSERVLLCADGMQVPILKSAVTVMYRGAQHIIESFIDISDIHAIKKAEREVRDANDEFQSFVYGASHDMRQPLVNIRGFSVELGRSYRDLQMIFERYADRIPVEDRERVSAIMSDDVRSAMEHIGSSVERMSAIIDALLGISKVGNQSLKLEPISMNSLTKFLLARAAEQIKEQNATVVVGDLPLVIADRSDVEQIMGSILDNALKYVVQGRPARVDISGERTGEAFVFHVRDNGCGISEEDIPKLFKVFRRLGRQNVPGAGVGLAYVKALVKHQGGNIWCESKLGVGSIFSFTIPHRVHHAE
jgi:signal transduction histidine kinase